MTRRLPPPGVCPSCRRPIDSDCDRLLIDLASNTGTIDGRPFRLPPRQMEILSAAMEKYPGAASLEYLLDRVYGALRDVGDDVVIVHISYMRRVLQMLGMWMDGGKSSGFRVVLPPLPDSMDEPT